MSALQRMTDWLARHPLYSVVVTLLLSLLAAALCLDPQTARPRVQLDASIDRLLPPANEDRAVFERAKALFGDSDGVLVAVDFGEVYTAEALKQIDRLSQKLADLPGVNGVFSLATAPNPLALGDAIDVSSFAVQAARNPAVIAGFPAQVAANPMYRGSLVTPDGRIASFVLGLSDEVTEKLFLERDYPALIRAEVRAVAGEAPVWITGTPVVKAATAEALFDTLRYVIPLILFLMIVVLMVAFRSTRATLVSVVTVVLALLWTFATISVLEMPLNLVTVIMPPLVMTLGFAYTVHVLSEFLQGEAGEAPAVRLRRTLDRVVVPTLLTGATTVAGFLTLYPSPLPAIKQFAVLCALGVGYASLLTFVFLPAALSLIGSSQHRALPGEKFFHAWSQRLAAFDVRNRTVIIVLSALLLPLGLGFATQIRSGSEYIQCFPEDAPVRTDFEAINTAFNGASFINLLIETHVNDALTDPALVAEISNLLDWLRLQPEVGSLVSYVDQLKLINQNLNEGDPAFYAVPNSAQLIKQVLVFGGDESLNSLIDARMRSAQVAVRINVSGSAEIRDLIERIDTRLKLLPPPLDVNVTGSAVLATRTVSAITSGQWQSLLAGFGLIWLMLALMFTSPRASLIAMLPNVIPVAVYFGALGILGIPLDATNSLIANIVLGVAVDDTIHYMARFNQDAREKGNEAAAVKSALADVLRPVTFNALALCLGFLAFAAGGLRNQAQFGMLAAFTLALGWLADLLLTPALGSYLRVVTLWDLLRLDLGRSPQHTIPVLSGLSLREARIFALMSKLETHAPGALIIKQGDYSKDVYVIVDGELQVFLERDEGRKDLTKMARGAVMGEAGYFGQRRTASVEALTPARVLRFDSQDLERMRLRYPRIAATIFRNINRIQAERLARTTAMLQ
mgnify:CR=1 FL=1